MKSPIKFLGGIAGAMAGGGGNSGTSNPGRIDIARALGQDYKSENFNHNRQLPGAIDHTTGMVNPQPNSSGMGGQDTTGLAVQPQQTTNVPPAASSLINPFSPEAQQNAQGVFGAQQLGSYDRVMPSSPLGKNGPIKESLKALAYAATGGLAPIVQAAEKLLGNKNKKAPSSQEIKKEHSSVKSLTAQKKYNDQLRKQQASKKTYTKTSQNK